MSLNSAAHDSEAKARRSVKRFYLDNENGLYLSSNNKIEPITLPEHRIRRLAQEGYVFYRTTHKATHEDIISGAAFVDRTPPTGKPVKVLLTDKQKVERRAARKADRESKKPLLAKLASLSTAELEAIANATVTQ